MKLQILVFGVLLLSSCTFFSKKDTNKDKAKELLSEITSQKNLLDDKINSIVSGLTKSDSDIAEIQESYLNWKNEFEKFNDKKVYMNYDLQLMKLEEMEIDLKKIKDQFSTLYSQ